MGYHKLRYLIVVWQINLLLCAMFTTPAKHHHKESQSKMKGVRRYLFMLPAWLALLAGCQQPPYQLDTSHQSPNQDARVRYLVVHYTQIDDADSLYELTRAESEVSAHYLLSREERDGVPVLYQLVPEDQRAWHAGASYWQGWRALNASSIGIEIVNLGYDPADAELPLGERRWQPYTEHQFRAVARLLLALTEPPPAWSAIAISRRVARWIRARAFPGSASIRSMALAPGQMRPRYRPCWPRQIPSPPMWQACKPCWLAMAMICPEAA